MQSCLIVLIIGVTQTLDCSAYAVGRGARVSTRVRVLGVRPAVAIMSADAERGAAAAASVATRRALLSAVLLAPATAAWASGGATAGKFTSIPIAKRRYYGRVQEAVYEWLLLEPNGRDEAASNAAFEVFFGENILIKKERTRSNCIGSSEACTSKEKKTSRWDDMQYAAACLGLRARPPHTRRAAYPRDAGGLSHAGSTACADALTCSPSARVSPACPYGRLTMFLLGNAFRIDSSKSPDRIKQVQQARKFFGEVKAFKESSQKQDPDGARQHFALARALLDEYLDAVDLPPSSYDRYKTPFDESSKKLCAGGNFCI
jgi:hypothetical protein